LDRDPRKVPNPAQHAVPRLEQGVPDVSIQGGLLPTDDGAFGGLIPIADKEDEPKMTYFKNQPAAMNQELSPPVDSFGGLIPIPDDEDYAEIEVVTGTAASSLRLEPVFMEPQGDFVEPVFEPVLPSLPRQDAWTPDDVLEESVEVIAAPVNEPAEESVEVIAAPVNEPAEESVEVIAAPADKRSEAAPEAGERASVGYLPPHPNRVRSTIHTTTIRTGISSRAKLEEFFRRRRSQRGGPAEAPDAGAVAECTEAGSSILERKVFTLTRAPEDAGVWVNYQGRSTWMGDTIDVGERARKGVKRGQRTRPLVREDYLEGVRDGLDEAIRELRCVLVEEDATIDEFWDVVERLVLKLPES
jgi:hypothetical protein